MLRYVQPVVSEELEISTKILYALAKEENITVSRDELSELLVCGSLPQNLLKVWETKGAEQLALYHMNSAASKGKIEELEVGSRLCSSLCCPSFDGSVSATRLLSLS